MPYKDIAKRKEFMRQYRLSNKDKIKNTCKAWVEQNKDRKYIKSRQWRERNKDKVNVGRKKHAQTLNGRRSAWKRGALVRGLVWDEELTLSYFESLPKICHYTNLPLIFDSNQPNTISLDRIDSSKGYIKENIVFCCADINYMKNNLTKERFVNLCKLVATNLS